MSAEIDDNLYNTLIDISQQEPILKSISEYSTPEELCNKLMASVILILDRESENFEKIQKFLESNKEVKKVLSKK